MPNKTIKDIIDKFDKLIVDGGGFYIEAVKEYLNSSLTSLLDSEIKEIEKAKQEVHKQTGSYKYDDQYDDCINIINSYK